MKTPWLTSTWFTSSSSLLLHQLLTVCPCPVPTPGWNARWRPFGRRRGGDRNWEEYSHLYVLRFLGHSAVLSEPEQQYVLEWKPRLQHWIDLVQVPALRVVGQLLLDSSSRFRVPAGFP